MREGMGLYTVGWRDGGGGAVSSPGRGAAWGMWLGIVAMSAGVLLMPASAPGTTLAPLKFDDVVATAERAIVGTVVDVHSSRSVANKFIYTFVTLNALRTLAGEPLREETYTLRFAGGEVNGHRQEIPGMPKFKVGERVCLFIHKNGTALCPVVGWTQGAFNVVKTKEGETLTDGVGCTVVGYDGLEGQLQYRCAQDADTKPRGSAGVTDDGSETRVIANLHANKRALTLDEFASLVATTRARTGFRPEPPPDKASRWIPSSALPELDGPPEYLTGDNVPREQASNQQATEE